MFKLLGFDVSVRPGFLMFTALIVFLYQDAFGLWLAGSLAVLTLLHELGHAVAARSSGAYAAISLDFMAGYTSFTPKRPLSKPRRALISIAGPATQIVISVAVLAAMGVNPLDLDSVRQSDATAAIWWAGPAIGLINLIPVLPLDGGHIAQTGLELVLGRPATREMAIVSLGLTIAAAVAIAVLGHTGFVVFLAFLLIGQSQILQATNRKARKVPVGPSATWSSDGPWLQPGMRQSPWQLAHQALLAGDSAKAGRLIVDDLTSDGEGPRWTPPSDAPIDQLQAVVETLPLDLPAGNAYSETVLVQVLLVTGHVRKAGEYAAEGFSRHRTPMLAMVVARSAARMGDPANALLWIRAATDATATSSAGERAAAAYSLDHAPELVTLRDDPEFQSARATVNA